MWKRPNRPNNEISESFTDGIVTVYAVSDKAEAGYQPVAELTKKVVLRYSTQRLGINRYYAARQNQIKIERVIRVPKTGNVSTQDAAITEDGQTYRIDMVQDVMDVYPQSADLTLVKFDQNFEVTEDDLV